MVPIADLDPPKKRTDILSGVLSDSLCGIRNFFLFDIHSIILTFDLTFLRTIYYIWHSISDFTCIPDFLFGYLAWGSGAIESWPAWPSEPAGHRVRVPHLAAEKTGMIWGLTILREKLLKNMTNPSHPVSNIIELYDYPLVN
jgi:hypothetical protein